MDITVIRDPDKPADPCIQKTFVTEYYDDLLLKRGITYKRHLLFRIYTSFISTLCTQVQLNQIIKNKFIVHVSCNSENRKQHLYVRNFTQILSLCQLCGVNDTSSHILNSSLLKCFKFQHGAGLLIAEISDQIAYYLKSYSVCFLVCFC